MVSSCRSTSLNFSARRYRNRVPSTPATLPPTTRLSQAANPERSKYGVSSPGLPSAWRARQRLWHSWLEQTWREARHWLPERILERGIDPGAGAGDCFRTANSSAVYGTGLASRTAICACSSSTFRVNAVSSELAGAAVEGVWRNGGQFFLQFIPPLLRLLQGRAQF